MKPPADVQRWEVLRASAASAIAAELVARNGLIAKYFPAEADGTVNVDVGQGHLLKAVFKTYFKLDPEKGEAALAKFPGADPAGEELAKRVVRRVLELRTGEFKKLPPKLAKLLRSAITESRGQPSLELVAPKAKP